VDRKDAVAVFGGDPGGIHFRADVEDR
jgi:hypothetical protein